MRVLPDLVRPGLRLLVVGTATECAADRGHYFSSRGHDFWKLLHESRLVADPLAAQDDGMLPDYGIGLTDLAAAPSRSAASAGVAVLEAKVERFQPGWVAFHGKTIAAVYARGAGHRPPGLGPVPWTVAGCPAFVLPSASGANRGGPWDGRPTRVSWWADLAELVDEVTAQPPRPAANGT
jgi:double-stranded uracil-DNA glycosylase